MTTEGDTRRRISPKEQRGRQSLYVARVCENRNKSEEVKGSQPKTALSVRGTSALKPTQGVEEERVRSSQAWTGKIPLS